MRTNYITALLLGLTIIMATGTAMAGKGDKPPKGDNAGKPDKPPKPPGGGGGDPLPSENELDPSYYNITHTPRIDFDSAEIDYSVSKRKIKATAEENFTLISPFGADAYSLADTNFKMEATLDKDGNLVDGWFKFTSKDSMFGFKGKKGGTLFEGLMTDIGWSADAGLLEFQTGNFSGWACDMGWCTETERLWFNVGGSGVDGLASAIGKGNDFSMDGIDGVAVIPVPAAVWLFGSGLIGLAAVARRKKA